MSLKVLVHERLHSLPNLVLVQELVAGLNIRIHETILGVRRNNATNEIVHSSQRLSSRVRSQEVKTLASSKKFNSKDMFHIINDLKSFSSTETTHRDVILLTTRSRNGIYRARMSENLVLRDERSSTAVSNHETTIQTTSLLRDQEGRKATERLIDETLNTALTDVGELMDTNSEVIKSLGRVLTVEIATRDDEALFAVTLEDHGVIGSTVHFSGQETSDELDGIVADTVDLRDATESVAVLDLALITEVIVDVRVVHVVVKNGTETTSDFDLTLVLSGLVDVGVVGSSGTTKSLEGQGHDDISLLGNALSSVESLATKSSDELSTVDESETLLGTKADGLETVLLEDGGGVTDGLGLGIPHLALSHEAESEVGERGEIAGSTDGSLLGDAGDAALVEGGDGTLEGLAGDTRVALGEDVDSESHDSLGALVGDEVTDTGGVGADEVVLELLEEVVGDGDLGEVAKTGVDTVGDLAAGNDGVDDGTAVLDLLPGLLREGHGVLSLGKIHQEFGSEGLTIEIKNRGFRQIGRAHV